jgi:hypothetical protein
MKKYYHDYEFQYLAFSLFDADARQTYHKVRLIFLYRLALELSNELLIEAS